jgi:hypothetical protein
VHLDLVAVEAEIDVCANAVLVARPVLSVGELKLPEERGEEADEKEFDDTVLRGVEVSVSKADVELIFVRTDGDTVVSDVTTGLAAAGVKDVWLPKIPELVMAASAEVEFARIGEQHEDKKRVPPLCITVTTTLVETVNRVGEAVLPFPSSDELDIIAKLLEDIVIESVPERLVAFAPTAMEPVPKLGGVGIPVAGDSAKNDEIEKLAVLPGIVPIKEAIREGLVLCGVVAGRLPMVELAAPELEVVLPSVAESAAFAKPVAVDEVAADGGSVAES